MTVFTKDPRSPELLEAFKKEGQVLLEVSFKCLYILRGEDERGLPELMKEWFVTWNGRSHAYRDGCHVGGGDVVTEVRDLTDGGKLVFESPDSEVRRTKQLEINCEWLRLQLDKAHEALCASQRGTWQQRAEQVVEAANKIAAGKGA